MARIVRAALLQAEWTGDKESMIEKHEKFAREAAAQGAKVMCFQELYGPYFARSGSAVLTATPSTFRRPDHEADASWQGDEWSSSCPCTRRTTRPPASLQHRSGDRRRWLLSRQYRKTHIPRKGFWEKYYSAPATWVSRFHRRRQGRCLHLLRPSLPRGRSRPGLGSAELVFIPSATSRGLPVPVARRAGLHAWPTATSSARSTGSASSPRRRRLLGSRTSSTARAVHR